MAQDVLYFVDGTKQLCKITAVDDQKLSYKNIDNLDGPTYTKAYNQLLLAFKDNGKYLAVTDKSYIYSSDPSEFLTNSASRRSDILITNKDEVITGSILTLEGEKLNYKKADNNSELVATIDKSSLAAVIYKNGKHQLFMNPAEAVVKLALVKEKVDKLTKATNDSTKSSVTAPSGKKDLSKADIERFQYKAKEKTDRLGTYLALIADKATERAEANKAVDAACGLFLSDSSRITVSNVNNNKKVKHTVRNYLKRLRLLPYDEVVVTWTNVGYVTNLKKGPDGNYYGSVTFQQVFEGYTDGKPLYRDVTQKSVQVVLKMYDWIEEGEKKQLWDVFLSDVGVEETRN
ncbi:hypothetical protein [Adhaeribacter aerolatus]|nr:hypothetical protein [Adhaeribacter aerolatus]